MTEEQLQLMKILARAIHDEEGEDVAAWNAFHDLVAECGFPSSAKQHCHHLHPSGLGCNFITILLG